MIFGVALNMVEGLKPVHRAALNSRSFGTPDEIFRQTEIDSHFRGEIRPDLACRIIQFDIRRAEKELEPAKKMGVQILTLDDPGYPTFLREFRTRRWSYMCEANSARRPCLAYRGVTKGHTLWSECDSIFIAGILRGGTNGCQRSGARNRRSCAQCSLQAGVDEPLQCWEAVWM